MSRKTLSRVTWVVFALVVVCQMWLYSRGEYSFVTRPIMVGEMDKAKLLEGPKPASIEEYNACFGKVAE